VRLCHEMTKIHESVVAGSVGEVLATLEKQALQGEWVIVVRVEEVDEIGEKEEGGQADARLR